MTTTSIQTLRDRSAEIGRELAAAAGPHERAAVAPTAEILRLQSSGIAALAVEPNAGGPGGTIADAAATALELARGDLAIGLLAAGHHAGIVGLRAAATERAVAAQIEIRTRGWLVAPAWPGALVPGGDLVDALVVPRGRDAEIVLSADPGLRRGAPVTAFGLRRLGIVPVDIETDGDAAGLDAVRSVLEAAALVGAGQASVDAATELTRVRTIPRPVPGVASATADPLSQVVLGAALGPFAAARALVFRAADRLDAQLDAGDVLGEDGARTLALAALEVAIAAALGQGRDVFEVVGTSGSGNAHGYDRLWRDARVFSLTRDAAARRQALGRAALVAA